MITKEKSKDLVTIFIEKGRQLEMSFKEWESIESMIVDNHGKDPVEIKNPPKPWSP